MAVVRFAFRLRLDCSRNCARPPNTTTTVRPPAWSLTARPPRVLTTTRCGRADASRIITGRGAKRCSSSLLLSAATGTCRARAGPVTPHRPRWPAFTSSRSTLFLVPGFARPGCRRRDRGGCRVRVAVTTLPDNPTGDIAAAEIVQRLTKVAREHDLIVVPDEIYYDPANFDEENVAAANYDAAPRLRPFCAAPSADGLVSRVHAIARIEDARADIAERTGRTGPVVLQRHRPVAAQVWRCAPRPCGCDRPDRGARSGVAVPQ